MCSGKFHSWSGSSEGLRAPHVPVFTNRFPGASSQGRSSNSADFGHGFFRIWFLRPVYYHHAALPCLDGGAGAERQALRRGGQVAARPAAVTVCDLSVAFPTATPSRSGL